MRDPATMMTDRTLAGSVRGVPLVERRVTVAYLATNVHGVITDCDDRSRRIRVVTDEGDELTVVLRPATARFHAVGQSPDALMLFDVTGSES
jgi:hypothetical protein